jgi:hypothetical protein
MRRTIASLEREQSALVRRLKRRIVQALEQEHDRLVAELNRVEIEVARLEREQAIHRREQAIRRAVTQAGVQAGVRAEFFDDLQYWAAGVLDVLEDGTVALVNAEGRPLRDAGGRWIDAAAWLTRWLPHRPAWVAVGGNGVRRGVSLSREVMNALCVRMPFKPPRWRVR